MDERLLAAYLATDYRVRLARGGWASIRVGAPLPAALAALTGERPWGFLTAWNPASSPLPRQQNRQAQRALLAALRELPDIAAILAGIGTGAGWREASLFVIGPGVAALDALARRFGQHAYVHAPNARAPALLRRMDNLIDVFGQSPG
jgi:hypothetical protein